MRPFSYLTFGTVTVFTGHSNSPLSGYTDVVVSSFDRIIRALLCCFFYAQLFQMGWLWPV